MPKKRGAVEDKMKVGQEKKLLGWEGKKWEFKNMRGKGEKKDKSEVRSQKSETFLCRGDRDSEF